MANGPALIESSSFTNYATYRKRSKGHDWSDAETLRFYRALNVVGTDFSLMQSLLFNKRSRRDLKNKFKREERRNPSLIEKALRYPGVFSNAEELQSEFATIEPPEKEKTEGKKGKGQKREKKCAPRSGQPPAKKKKRGKHWLVDGNVSQGEESEDNGSIANELQKEVEADAGKSVDGGTPEVVFSVSSEEVMMASQEIVLTNEDSLPPSCGEKSEEESDASESSESGFLSRVLQPTRSGRIPKRREVKVLPNQRKAQPKEKSDGSLKKETAVEEIACSTDHLERDPLETDPLETDPLDDPRPTVSIEVRDCAPSNMDVSVVEPGSLVVIATTASDDPSRKVYEVFMVAPQIQDSLLISQNVSIEENIGMIKGDSKMFPSNHSEGVICPAEGFESCSMDTNVGLQT
ncbi:hypothetical protein J437_LFUL011294 [Ladona fulva]|uniref:Myb-like domain-containing protein n=1 Tax=Ladona fulva TaxID=123851 RepID=A0A8K0KL37_LADFU|nr:hypothetical protein J437_LFUL011294 [Ladona fulva]